MTTDYREIVGGVAKEQKLTDKQREKLEQAFTEVFEKGIAPKDAIGLSDQTIELIYANAYRLYQAAKYKDAGYIFHLLQSLNPKDARFYLGMGACLHRLGNYETASFMYEVSGELDKGNPMPLYYGSDCRMKMGHFKKAASMLLEVIERCKEKPEYIPVRDRSLMTIQSIQQESIKETTLQEEAKKVKEELQTKGQS